MEKKFDFLNKEVNLGDTVVFVQKDYRNLMKGTVKKMTDKTVLIEHEKTNMCSTETRQCYGQIIVIEKKPQIKFEKLPSYGDLMTIEEWLENVECGGFIDYDGSGTLAYKDKMSDIDVYPSMVKSGMFQMIRGDFTHVVWFNR